jgi:hypothetical protein
MLGCLFTLVVLGTAAYVALLFARPWFANQQFQDDFQVAARFASATSDSTIRARLVARADSLGLPKEAKRISIRRFTNEGIVRIAARYDVTIQVPIVGERVMHFDLSVEEPLQ